MVRRALVEKNLATLRTKLQTAKMKYLTEGEISGEDYHDVKAELEFRIAQCEQELKTCSISCSNFSEYASTTLQIASSLGSEWEKMNFKVCQEIQDLVFPEGVLWDKENRIPRTENMNPFFAQIGLVARSVKGVDIKNKDSAEALSCLVAGGGLEPPVLFGSGRRTRTTDLRVMSPTSYQLLYPAMLDCKSNNNFYNGKIFCAFHHFSTSSRLHPLSPTGIKKPSAPGWPYQICCLPGADGFCLSLYSAYLISTSASILARICGRAISPSSSATASAPSRRPASPNLTDAVSAPNIASSSSMALRGLG